MAGGVAPGEGLTGEALSGARHKPGRRGRRRPLALAQPVAGDLLALTALSLILVGLLAAVALLAPTRVAFDLDRPPSSVVLHNFYDPERNDSGPYRWTKPYASLSIPLDAPADYRITLDLQDGPASRPPRTVTVYVAGAPADTITLTPTVREYVFRYPMTWQTWTRREGRTLSVELQTQPLAAAGDPRALGVIVARAAIAPAPPVRPDWLALLGPNLALLIASYTTLRLLGAGVAGAAGTLGAPQAAYALIGGGARATAVSLSYQASNHPLVVLGLVVLLAGVPLLAWAIPRWADARRAPLGSRLMLPAGLGVALGLFVTLRVVFSLFALVASLALPPPGPCAWEGNAPARMAGWSLHLLGVWQRWDACWYEQIASVGYRPGDFVVAFFPLYPLLTRAASVPLLGNVALGGLLVSGVAYVAAIAGLYRLVSADFDREVAQRAVLYLSLFPAAFFLFAPFTEALFLALAVWTLVAARRGAWGWAALAAFLAALTRTQGCLLALPLAWEGWRQWRAGRGRFDSVPADDKNWPPLRRQWRAGRGRFGRALAPLAPLGGLVAFTAYTKAVAGLTPFQAQDEKWLSAFYAPWTVVALSWQHIRRYGDVIQGLNLVVLALFSVLLIVGLWRLPATYSLYAVPQLLLLETRTLSTWLASTTRLVLVIFPAFICLALLGRRRGVHAAWLVVSLWLLAILFYAFLSDVFVA